MEEEKILVGGKEMTIKVYDGFRFPRVFIGNVADHLKKIEDMQCREDDVFIMSYPKSGNHWIREIVHMIQCRCVKYCPVDEPDATIGLIEMNTINELRSPRTFYTTMPFRYLPKEYKRRRGKVITIFRDFRDVATSFYHFFNRVGTDICWEEFLNVLMAGKFPYGCWFDWKDDFEDTIKQNPDYPILIVKYEDLQKDLKGGIKRIAEFLEIQLDEVTLDDITEACTFAATKKAKSETLPDNVKTMSLDGKDPFFRKGISGDWKTLFTVGLNENVKAIMKKRRREGSVLSYPDDD